METNLSVEIMARTQPGLIEVYICASHCRLYSLKLEMCGRDRPDRRIEP